MGRVRLKRVAVSLMQIEICVFAQNVTGVDACTMYIPTNDLFCVKEMCYEECVY
jgi:hypothetical protein